MRAEERRRSSKERAAPGTFQSSEPPNYLTEVHTQPLEPQCRADFARHRFTSAKLPWVFFWNDFLNRDLPVALDPQPEFPLDHNGCHCAPNLCWRQCEALRSPADRLALLRIRAV